MSKRSAIFLCDLTGNMARPWAEAGYECWCIDIQHSIRRDRTVRVGDGAIHFVWGDARSYCPPREAVDGLRFMAAFPPCPHLTCTAARDFKKKGGWMLADAVQIFDSCMTVCTFSGVPFMVENPAVSRLNTHRRGPDFTFHPWEYAGYLQDQEEENTSKSTGLWVGGGFVMPPKKPAPEPHRQDCWMAPPSDDRANERSATPMGFARAAFTANHAEQ